jgi:hypothetical protein
LSLQLLGPTESAFDAAPRLLLRTDALTIWTSHLRDFGKSGT